MRVYHSIVNNNFVSHTEFSVVSLILSILPVLSRVMFNCARKVIKIHLAS